jgi:UDP-GlcNAc3NAcA epimerase
MKVLSVVGARPQFIKAAAVARAIAADQRLRVEHALLHTGQHYDHNMSKAFFDELGLPEPDANLEVGSGPQGQQTGRMLERVEAYLLSRAPEWVLVYGDTNSTLAGALAARKLNIRVGHVEAGLRSYDRSMPEETNRVLCDAVSDVLFCPTETAVRNLQSEGYLNIVAGGSLSDASTFTGPTLAGKWPVVINVGDVMYDALQLFAPRVPTSSAVLARYGFDDSPYILVTIHRVQNTDDPERASSLVATLNELATFSRIILPLHPRTRAAYERFGLLTKLKSTRLQLAEPFSYLEMVALERGAEAIVTDSGGVQKEAFCLGTPCVTLRPSTEWTETLQGGWNRLVEPDPSRIVEVVAAAIQVRQSAPDGVMYGLGQAARSIVGILMALDSCN